MNRRNGIVFPCTTFSFHLENWNNLLHNEMGLQNVNCSIVIFNPSWLNRQLHNWPKESNSSSCQVLQEIQTCQGRLKKKKMATIFCSSSHQEVEIISTALESGFGHTTCFGQCFISKYDACRGLKSACALGLLSFAAGNSETTMWRSLGYPLGWWENTCQEGTKNHQQTRDQPAWPRLEELLGWPRESWTNEN